MWYNIALTCFHVLIEKVKISVVVVVTVDIINFVFKLDLIVQNDSFNNHQWTLS